MKTKLCIALLLIFTLVSLSYTQSSAPPERSDYKDMVQQSTAPPAPGVRTRLAFTGTGLNDFTPVAASYTLTAIHSYTFVIDGTGTPNTFKWKKDAGGFTAGVAITGANQVISDVTVKWAATIGHTLNAQWVVTKTPVSRFYMDSTGWMNIKRNDGTLVSPMINGGAGSVTMLDLVTGGDPATPSAGTARLYSFTGDNPRIKFSNGISKQVITSGSNTYPGGDIQTFVADDAQTFLYTVLQLVNSTPSTALVPVQNSPTISFINSGWDGAADKQFAWNLFVSPTGTSARSKFAFETYIASFNRFEAASISSDGTDGILDVKSAIRVNGSAITGYTPITGQNYTTLVTDRFIGVEPSGSDRTITLISAAGVPAGYELTVKHIGTANNVLIDPNGSEAIDGSASNRTLTTYQSLTIVSSGSAWFIK